MVSQEQDVFDDLQNIAVTKQMKDRTKSSIVMND